MKKIASLIIVVLALVAVNLAWIAVLTNTPLSLALAQPRFTPAAPEGVVQSVIHQEASLPSVAAASVQSPAMAMRLRSLTAKELEAQPAAQVVRQGGLQFQGPGPRTSATELVSPQAPSETCQDMLANPQMDVLENGDGTGTVDSWTILSPIIYYSKVYSHSAPYSLKEMDELDGSDPVSITIGGVLWDYDEFGQLFRAPAGLTYLKVSFSSLYRDRDANDETWARLWTVNSQNQLDKFISAVPVPTDPSVYPEYTWANLYWELNSAQLITASNKTLALVFTSFGNRASPGQGVYFDDAQVRLCYATGPVKIYLPVLTKSPPQTGPVCVLYEPDNRDNRGNVTVGATCNGALGPSDDKDYYTLNLAGVTDVRLRLFNLPSEGSRWDAAIYEYPYITGQPPACWIGKEGLDKSEDCRGLNLNKTYFVLVAAGSAQSNPRSYSMSVTSLSGPPTPTPTSQSGPTPGFWSSTTGDEFYVSPDRANVLKFAIYINIPQCGGTVKITRNTPAPISGNSFSFTGSFYASGTFDSSTSAHGTDGLSSFPINIPGVCSGTITEGPWAWTATWKNSNQPTVINVKPAGPITAEFSDAASGSHTVTELK